MEGMGGNTILPHDLSHSLRGDRTSKRRRRLLIRIVRPTQPLNRIVRSELQQQHHKSEHCQEYSQPPAIWPDHGAFLDFDFNIIQFSPGPAPPRAACGTNVTLPTIQSFISFRSENGSPDCISAAIDHICRIHPLLAVPHRSLALGSPVEGL